MKESELQHTILHYLNMQSDIFAWKNSSTGTFDHKKGVYRKKAGFEIKGVSDILAIHSPSGRLIAIEVKRPETTAGSVSKEQKAFISKINMMGGRAAWVNSLDMVMEIIKNVRND